jgi:hypothetical protein
VGKRCLHQWTGDPVTCRVCGKRAHASPSQIETWGRVQLEKSDDGTLVPRRVGCRRKWKFQRLRGKQGSTPAAEFGHQCHLNLENYMRHGTWTPEIAKSPEGKCLAAGLAYFPPPRVGLAETEIYEEIGGVLWMMQADAVSQWIPGVSILVQDLKTTGDLKWQKTPEQLADDPQRIAYAAWAASHVDVRSVTAEWVYCRRKPPKASTTRYEESVEDTRKRLDILIEETVRPMLAANCLPLEAFPRDGLQTGECERYSRDGCEFKAECHAGINPLDLLAHRLVS